MRERRLFLLLLMLALIFAAPLAAIALDGCAEDDCPPSCGDCTLCAHAAVFAALPVRLTAAVPAERGPELAPLLVSAPSRALEHVPLSQG